MTEKSELLESLERLTATHRAHVASLEAATAEARDVARALARDLVTVCELLPTAHVGEAAVVQGAVQRARRVLAANLGGRYETK